MKRTLILFGVALLALGLRAQQSQKLLRSGNSEYEKGHFKEAEIDYRKALTSNPASGKAKYNLGNALYKQNNYEEAAKEYLGVAGTPKPAVKRSDAFYNLGNALLQSNKMQESIKAYKEALRANPRDEDARYNLAYALARLNQQKNQQQNKDIKQQQQPQQQQQQANPQKVNFDKKDADKMLKAMEQNEKHTLQKKNKAQSSSRSTPEKDW